MSTPPTSTSEPTILIDAKGIEREYGIGLHTAYRIMGAIGIIRPRERGRLFVRRDELEAYLEARREPPYPGYDPGEDGC